MPSESRQLPTDRMLVPKVAELSEKFETLRALSYMDKDFRGWGLVGGLAFGLAPAFGAHAMRTFVALMRGINVGAARKLPMADLRALCEKAGLERPQTYIQSGNLIVDAKGDATALGRLLEKEIAARFGFAVDVIVCAAGKWEGYVAVNPFAGDASAVPKTVHLYLTRDPLKSGAATALEQRAQSGERMLWIDYGANGVAGSKLSLLLIDMACGSPTTGRNWNSVLKIGKMIDARMKKI